MAAPVVHRLPDPETVSRKAAGIFRDFATRYIASKGIFTVALSGGTTPRRLYELLATDEFREVIQWNRVVFFWGDERSVPPDHKDSNFRMAHEALLHRLDIPAENVHPIRSELEPETAAALYESELKKALPSEKGMPVLDLLMLGVGADGHTASLFPGSSALDETERLAVAVYDRETPRVTLTLPVINSARHILFLATGGEKREVIGKILSGEGNHPAGMVNLDHAIWLLDEAAAPATPRQPE